MTVDERAEEVKQARHARYYLRMEELGKAFLKAFTDHAARAKVLYELHMGHWQQYDETPSRPQVSLAQSLHYARASADEADLAGDIAGKLFATMNIGGHILPASGDWKAGMELLRETLRSANEAQPGSGDDWARFERVKMSCYVFLIQLSAKYNLDHQEVAGWLHHLERNKIFQETAEKNPTLTAQWVTTARDYIGRAR